MQLFSKAVLSVIVLSGLILTVLILVFPLNEDGSVARNSNKMIQQTDGQLNQGISNQPNLENSAAIELSADSQNIQASVSNDEPENTDSLIQLLEIEPAASEREILIEQFHQLSSPQEYATQESAPASEREKDFLAAASKSLLEAEAENLAQQSDQDYSADNQYESWEVTEEREQSVQQFKQSQTPERYQAQSGGGSDVQKAASAPEREKQFLNSASDFLTREHGM